MLAPADHPLSRCHTGLVQELLTIMRLLRGPGGCPWDQAQTHHSLMPYLLEEAAEAVDAASDPAALCGELGDVLLQVAFHSVIAEETGEFDYQAVEQHIVQKLTRRHPHVFGEVKVADAQEVWQNWQAIKARERGGQAPPPSAQIPSALGALAREAKAQKLAEVAPLSWPAVQARLSTLSDDAAGLAELLSLAVAWARASGLDPELLLREHTLRRLAQLDTDHAAPVE